MRTLNISLILFSILIVFGCSSGDGDTPPSTSMSHDTLVLALDWSPNILHAGFFLALEQDAFSEANLVIEWFSPETDNYQKKPIQRLMDGEVDLCIGPSEHLMFYAYDEKNMKPEARAIASLLSKGQSAFVSHQIAGMRNPANWPGNTYIGYDTPLETAIIQSMVEYSGGKGMVQMVQPGRLQVWDAFLEKGNSIAWIFSHWEGQLAKMQGVELDYFYPEEYGVPYGYSSVIMAGNQLSKEKKEQLKKFLSVLSNSYSKLATTENIPKMAGLLCSFVDHPNFSDKKMIAAALSDIQPALSTEGNRVWGEMKEQRWAAYINWMRQNELIPDQVAKVPSADWYTHEYLPVEN